MVMRTRLYLLASRFSGNGGPLSHAASIRAAKAPSPPDNRLASVAALKNGWPSGCSPSRAMSARGWVLAWVT